MRASQPKQYLRIGLQTVIEHALTHLMVHPDLTEIIIVVAKDDCYLTHLPIVKHPRVRVVLGGESRAESVLAGLQVVSSANAWALVHDAARPCLHAIDLDQLLAARYTNAHGAILAAPVQNTLKRQHPEVAAIEQTVSRENLWQAMTPQLFPCALLQTCLTRALAAGCVITDESSAMEYCGYRPRLIPGRNDNIKVTQPEDVVLATAIINYRDAYKGA